MSPSFLTDAQLRAELQKCQSCETKPCKGGCPASCSPADFILAARCGEPSDYRRAAAHILAHNPLGGVCGAVCPDSLCMARCARRGFDAAVNIPAVQAAIVRKARQLGVLPRPESPRGTGHRIAVVGAGPAGLGAASVLATAGHTVHVFDATRKPGGMARLIPRHRLDPEVLASDIAWLLGLGDLRLVLGKPVALPRDLLARGFAAVIVAAGLSEAVELDVPGRERALGWPQVLGTRPPTLRGKRVAIVGDGAVAVDCAEAALAQEAAHVELFARKKLSELALTRRERDRLFASGVHVSCRVRVTAIRGRGARITGLELRKVELPAGKAFHPSRLVDLRHGEHVRRDIDTVVLAMGGRPGLRLETHPRVFYAGDLESGPTSVVEALASGKKAGLAVHEMLAGGDPAPCPDRTSCPDGSACPQRATCPEWNGRATPDYGASGGARRLAGLPVPLSSDFFGRRVGSPFLLSAGSPTQGYAQMQRAYRAGWAGGVMQAAAVSLPFTGETRFASRASLSSHERCRDASDRGVDRVCSEVEQLRSEFPDRLTLVSTRGPVTGSHEADARIWQANTRKLDSAGAMGVEYALCLPQGGDGTSGGAGSPDPELSARIVDWVLAVSDPSVPKLFKIAAPDTAIEPVLASIARVFAHHPGKLAGVTLAGTTSTLAISAARHGLFVSGDGGSMDYRGATTLLALGAHNVQLGAIVTKYGLGILNELHSGLSYYLAELGMRSVSELVGSALVRSIAALGELPTDEVACEVDPALCTGCGNCTRCSQLAMTLDARGLPSVDPTRCIGCAVCVQQCFAGALAMRRRSAYPGRS